MDFIPAKDSDLDAWSQNFDTLITDTPTAFGLVSGDATAFHTLAAAFTAALAASTNPATRTSVTVATTKTARAALVFKARALAKVVNGDPDTTNSQRTNLGLTVRDSVPTRIVPPTTVPVITNDGTAGFLTQLRVVDEATPTKKAKPHGVLGMELFYQVAGTLPTGVAAMKYAGLHTRSIGSIPWDGADVGKTFYLIGRWINARGEPGPISDVVSGTIAA